jgi:cell division protein FtsB
MAMTAIRERLKAGALNLTGRFRNAAHDPSERKRRRRRLALALVGGTLLWTVFGGDQGLVALGMSWHEQWALKREIARLEVETREMKAKDEALARDRAYYEKIAREKLMLRRPGELVYRFDNR